MVRTLAALLALSLATATARAETFRVFGSAGAESQLAPANTNSPLNPGNVLRLPDQTNSGDLTVFLEAGPESRKWKLRAKVRAEATDRADDDVKLGEVVLQWQPASWLDLSAGRAIEKWGTGYGWTPTAFIGPARNPTDPNDRRSASVGVDMIRADLFAKETNLSLYALRDGIVAARAYRLVRGTDVSLVYRHDDDGTRTGISLSRVFGDALELHGEVARVGSTMRAVAGGQYTFANNVNLILELYHGTDGLTAGEWDAFRDSIQTPADLADANRRYSPLRMARTYAFTRVQRNFERIKTDVELIAIANLRDGSTILRTTVTRRLRNNLSAYLIATEFLGNSSTELGYLQVERVTAAGVRVHF